METFDASWLAIREPWDARARSSALVESIRGSLPAPHQPLRVLDLGSGTGSNLRYLAHRLERSQEWLLTDHDPVLLEQASRLVSEWIGDRGPGATPCAAATRVVDLAAVDLDSVVAGRQLVTGAALLDLVSDAWLTRLVGACARHRTHVLFALTYDGRLACEPGDADDVMIRALVNEHQRIDKGFGGALGPTAADHLVERLAAHGYDVGRRSTAWELPPEATAIQQSLIDGWAHAAAVLAPDRSEMIAAWRARRLAHVDAGESRLTVGHADVAGSPGGRKP